MKPSDLTALLSKPAGLDLADKNLEIRNVRLLQQDGTYLNCAAANPFAQRDDQPDMFKAYVDFEICHTFPQIIGPTMSGAYVGYHPGVLAKNYRGLVHQWMNLRHMTKANDPEGKQRDRIVGCIIAASFPPTPPQGWKIPATAAEAPCVTVRAVLFKLAEGMNHIIGAHQTSRQKWSVSIEVDATLDNVGIYLPSTREIWSLAEVPEDLLEAVTVDKKSKNLVVGKARGEQLAFAYGIINGKLHFRGVGMTPNPAERTAKITSIMAEDGAEMFSIAAEKIEEQLLVGKTCTWDGGRFKGTIQEIKSSGKMQHPQHAWQLEASEENPAVKIYLPNGQVVMKRFEAIDLAA